MQRVPHLMIALRFRLRARGLPDRKKIWFCRGSGGSEPGSGTGAVLLGPRDDAGGTGDVVRSSSGTRLCSGLTLREENMVLIRDARVQSFEAELSADCVPSSVRFWVLSDGD